MDLVLPWDRSTIATASDRAEMLRTERSTRIAEYGRCRFVPALDVLARRLSIRREVEKAVPLAQARCRVAAGAHELA